MKDIKFRVWNGSEMIYDITVGKFGVFYVNPGNNGDGLDPNDSASLTSFTTKYHDDIPVMQYIGIVDNNKQPIYEGDIVQNKNNESNRWVIKKIDNGFFAVRIPDQIKTRDKKFIMNDLYVIGNIYQNDELLK